MAEHAGRLPRADRDAWKKGVEARHNGKSSVVLDTGDYVHFVDKNDFMTRTLGKEAWGCLLQHLGSAHSTVALANIGFATKGRKMCVLSTRFKSPAKEWARAVKIEIETTLKCSCFSPNENNINRMEGQEDQADRDARWLMVFMWACKAAALSGGSMVQLIIPGLGLSPMQFAEEQIAQSMELTVERKVLCEAENDKYDLKIKEIEKHLFQSAKHKQTEALKELINNLKDPKDGDYVGVVKNVAVATYKQEVNQPLFDLGAVPLLTDIVKRKDGQPNARQHAALALANIACLGDAVSKQIAEHKIVPWLIDELSLQSSSGKFEAVFALKHLSRAGDMKELIVASGGISPLVELLREGSPDEKTEAAETLAHLREEAAETLAHLALGEDEIRSKMVAKDVIRHLVHLLQHGTPAGKEQAAAALRNLACARDDIKQKIAAVGGIRALEDLLREGTPSGKEQAAAALKNIKEDHVEEGRHKLLADNGKIVFVALCFVLLYFCTDSDPDTGKAIFIVVIVGLTLYGFRRQIQRLCNGGSCAAPKLTEEALEGGLAAERVGARGTE